MKKILIFSITILGIFSFSIASSATETTIPEWIKNNAKWWSEGSISEKDYIKSLEYLITNRIINIPIPISEVIAAQTSLTDEERAQSFKVTISNIVAPISASYFEKFELTSSQPGTADDPRGRMFEFGDINPQFYLESLPSTDKTQFYEFVGNWMERGDKLNEFDVEVAV